MLLRGENDLKQSNEIQPTSRYVLRKPKGVQKVDSYNYILYKVQPPEVHTPLFPCVILFHYCLLYYTRCNHLKHTSLFPCVMFHYCLLQVPVVQKVDNAISIQTERYPMDSAIRFPNKYLCTQSSE